MHKHWPTICRLKNPWLRMLVTTTNDPEMLQSLQRGFPELFSETGIEPQVPLSAIRQYLAEAEYALWQGPLEHFSIPYFRWGANSGDIAVEVPHEWREVVAKLPRTADGAYDLLYEMEAPILLDWNGQKCLLVEAYDYFPEEGTIEGLTLVPVGFIDLDA